MRKRNKIVAVFMSIMVVFSTVYTLILPAAAMEVQTEESVDQTEVEQPETPVPVLACTAKAHVHTEECYQEILQEDGTSQKILICGLADYICHVHNEACVNAEGVLVCPLPEIKPHEHTEECWEEQEVLICGQKDSRGHVHDASCYTREKGELICTVPENHVHGDACYMVTESIICDLEESGEEDGHQHGSECKTPEQILTCSIPEGHVHGDECYAWNDVVSCGMEEGQGGHAHTVDCIKKEKVLMCGKQELHRHSESCYDENHNLICGLWQIEEHVHGEECFQSVPVENDDAENTDESPAEDEPVEGEPVEGGPAEEEPTEGEPAEGEPAEGDPVEGEPAEGAPADENQAEAQDPTLPKVTYLETETGGENTVQAAGEDTAPTAGEDVAPTTEEDTVSTAGEDTAPTAGEDSVPTTGENTVQTEKSVQVEKIDATESVRGSVEECVKTAGRTVDHIEIYRLTPEQDGDFSGKNLKVEYPAGMGLGITAGESESGLCVLDLGAEGKEAPVSCTVSDSRTITDNGYMDFEFTAGVESAAGGRVYAFVSTKPVAPVPSIYPGEQQENGTWVAYDAPYSDPALEAATVRVTVTLPGDVKDPAEDGYKLFIRRINPGESYYPTEESVTKKASAYNDYQCYMIRWVKVDGDGNIHEDNMKTMSEILSAGGGDAEKTAEVKIDYLKDDVMLKGPAGGRKLLIFNSDEKGSLLDTISDTVENVIVEKNTYKSFTFRTNQAGPYVFVSKTLEKGYISGIAIQSIVDGTEPFDLSNTPGNDSGDNNKIVRSYDTVKYNLITTFAARENGITQESVKMYFELSLRKSSTAARFDTSQMLWLGSHYCIEYLDENRDEKHNVVMVQASDGKFYEPQQNEDGTIYRDSAGFAQPDKSKQVKLNGRVDGSTKGKDSYKVSGGGITKQKLTGWKIVTPKEGGTNVLAGTQNFSAAIEVRNADNGEEFTPTFKMWLEGNEDNYGSETTEDSQMTPAQPVKDNVLTADGNNAVKVSAGTNFNIQLKKNSDMSYKNWFNFSTGQLVDAGTRQELVRLANLKDNHGKSKPEEFVDENGTALPPKKKEEYKNYRYGRITCYGITLQLYNDTDNEPDKNRAAKGLKGLSLPVGDITFDLNFTSEVTSGGNSFEGSNSEYTPILWDYNENVPAENSYTKTYVDPGRGTVKTPKDGKGNGGRQLYWDYEPRSSYAKGAGPSNYISYHDGCYYGGDWKLIDGEGKAVDGIAALNQVASPVAVTGTGADTTYHFSVSDYDFDFDDHHFPLRDAGNSGNVTGYDSYARCFSAGCIQVLSVFPMVQKQDTANIQLNTTVNNLHLTTRADQELIAKEDDETKINHEVNKKDNKKSDQIVLYAPGNLTKGSSFNGMWIIR